MNDSIACGIKMQRETFMSAPAIIIAASHSAFRNRMAQVLTEKGTPVETTDSAACLMAALLRGGAPIVILSDGLEEGVPLPRLVPLLKRCNRHATIILAAVGLPLEEEIKIHRSGIFCRTGQSIGATDRNELQLAVTCAQRRQSQVAFPANCH